MRIKKILKHELMFSIILFVFMRDVLPANILTIAPFPSWSHQQLLLAVSKELTKRGHNLTVMTTNPPKENIENWTSIDLSSSYNRLREFEGEFGFTMQISWGAFSLLSVASQLMSQVCDHALSLPEVQDFIRYQSKTKYDVVLLENLMFSSFSGLVHKIGSPPVVGIHTFPNWFPTDWPKGIPVNPSYMVDAHIGFTNKMEFFQRVLNTIYYWYAEYQSEMNIIPMQQAILTKYFGHDVPSAREFEYNKSLILQIADLTLVYPQPQPPNVIQIGPIHIRQPKSLPEDLEEWFHGAKDGVCYFSLGSNIKSISLPQEKQEAFVKAFAKFPKIRFLWKYESSKKLPGLSSNVLTREWIPQQDVLGHKKLRLFITQGGLQSLQEAINHGVPTLSIPMFADQLGNAQKIVQEGAGIRLDMNDVTPETLHHEITRILHDGKDTFKGNASRLSKITRDRIAPAMETAVWWIEYVIRHNGARHLRMASFDLSWYQLALIDVYAFLLIFLFIISCLIYFSSKYIVNIIFKMVSETKLCGYKNKGDRRRQNLDVSKKIQ